MKLKTYVEQNEIKLVDLGNALNVSQTAISRYVNETRIPTKENMQKITEFTKGAVTANDFFETYQPEAGA
jgi:transcriptional regulator with XRE-family HTH domain